MSTNEDVVKLPRQLVRRQLIERFLEVVTHLWPGLPRAQRRTAALSWMHKFQGQVRTAGIIPTADQLLTGVMSVIQKQKEQINEA